MPKGPQGQKRPADAVARAVMVAKIATGEIDESLSRTIEDRAKAGGKARANKLSPKKRSEIATKAAQKRWRKPEPQT